MTHISPRLAGGLCALALTTVSASAAPLQVQAPAFNQVPYVVTTGDVEVAPAPSTELELASSMVVDQPGADWMRIYFDEALLAGDVLSGTGAELRLLSLVDGGYQVMNAIELERWDRSTAYFNGDTVVMEVWARPGTGVSRVSVRSLDVGIAPAIDGRSICGPLDDRLPSTDPRSGRLLPIGCTGWLIQDCAGCALTAGHCTGNINVLQFNVPPSLSNGSIQNPPPSDQYPVDPASLQTNGGQGVGNDYAYFGTFPNGTTGLTATGAQGPGFALMSPPSAGNGTIRITGFGTDSSPPTRNQVQQTHTGPLVTNSGTTVQYATDTTGGNSGSPVIWEEMGVAVGIHTHGGCSSTGGQNSGTSYNSGGLQGFLASPQGICGAGISLMNPPTLVDRGEIATIAVQANGPLVAGSATLHFRSSGTGMFQSAPLSDMGSGLLTGDLPAFDCDDSPEFFVSAQSTSCGQIFVPAGGPADPLTLEVGVASVAFGDDFQTDTGWQTEVLGASSGQWQRGVPVNDSGWAYDPASDGDGSGACYLTQNAAGNTDVDGGAVRLTSPLTAVNAAGTEVRFLRYLALTNENAEDEMLVEVSPDGVSQWSTVASYRTNTGDGWQQEVISAADLAAAGITPGSNIAVRFTVNDADTQSIVEAGVDGFSVQSITCDPTRVGSNYCGPAVANSTGFPATLRGNGSDVLADNDLLLTAEGLPQSSFGYFLTSQTTDNVPNPGGSSGTLCLGGSIGRYSNTVLNSGAMGSFQLMIDLTTISQPNGAVAGVVGETWHFQAWFRDFVLVTTSNFTDGLSVTLR